METLEFKTSIKAPIQNVWHTMLGANTYPEWTAAAWPGSRFEGEWKEGGKLRFVGGDGSGTLARLKRVEPHEAIQAEHIAILGPGGTVETESDAAKGWVGTTESYFFREADGVTNLWVEIRTRPEWADMFREGWPVALDKLKEMCERQHAPV